MQIINQSYEILTFISKEHIYKAIELSEELHIKVKIK